MESEIIKTVSSDIRAQAHPHCVACSPTNIQGMQLEFTLSTDSSVSASFHLGRPYESYRGILHGGVLSMILDEAMTYCLFAYDGAAITGDLRDQVTSDFKYNLCELRGKTLANPIGTTRISE